MSLCHLRFGLVVVDAVLRSGQDLTGFAEGCGEGAVGAGGIGLLGIQRINNAVVVPVEGRHDRKVFGLVQQTAVDLTCSGINEVCPDLVGHGIHEVAAGLQHRRGFAAGGKVIEHPSLCDGPGPVNLLPSAPGGDLKGLGLVVDDLVALCSAQGYRMRAGHIEAHRIGALVENAGFSGVVRIPIKVPVNGIND